MTQLIKNIASSTVVPHFNALFHQLDPVQQNKSSSSKISSASQNHKYKISFHFLFCFVFFNFICLDINLGLHYEANGSCWNLLTTSQYILMRQMFPPLLHFLLDPIMLLNMLLTSISLLYFTFYSHFSEAANIYPINNGLNVQLNGKVLDRSLSGAILRFSRNAKRMLSTLAIFFNVFSNMYVGVMIYLNGFFRPTTHNFIAVFILMPFHNFYIIYGEILKFNIFNVNIILIILKL